MYILKIKNLKKSFKSTHFLSPKKVILDQVSFCISQGVSTGFLGSNGSGKSTTLKCLLGLIPYDKGDISFFKDLVLSKTVLKKIGFLPEQPVFYDYLTGEELLLFYGHLSTSLKKAELKKNISSLLKQLEIFYIKDQKIKTYSKGMLQKLGIAQAFIHDPELVILDEPLSGLDPDSRLCVGHLIQNKIQQGVTVFFSSHLLYDVEKLCRDVVILKQGKIIYEDNVQNLLDSIKSRRQITFLENNKKHIVFTNSLKDCQNQIDLLRKRSCFILDIQHDTQNLEKAFVGITKSH